MHLSENERNFLMQFLPRAFEPHQLVQELLSGDNFHFGNPFLKWQDLFLNNFSLETLSAVFSMCTIDLRYCY